MSTIIHDTKDGVMQEWLKSEGLEPGMMMPRPDRFRTALTIGVSYAFVIYITMMAFNVALWLGLFWYLLIGMLLQCSQCYQNDEYPSVLSVTFYAFWPITTPIGIVVIIRQWFEPIRHNRRFRRGRAAKA